MKMKWVVLIIISACIFVQRTSAQSCGAYTYNDEWNDNAAAYTENYTDGDSGCGAYSATSLISITTPSGTYRAIRAAACCADAVLSAPPPIEGEENDGTMTNSVTYSCGAHLFCRHQLPGLL